LPSVRAACLASRRPRRPPSRRKSRSTSSSPRKKDAAEAIQLSGTLLAEFSFTETSGGNVEIGFHFNPQGITGVGLTSGATYHATGETLGTTTVRANGGISDTFVNNFKIIGEGSAQNFLETEIVHLTVNAKGEVTASVEKSMLRCV
jgi:hypothetical protein